jgi:hypothetical protein
MTVTAMENEKKLLAAILPHGRFYFYWLPVLVGLAVFCGGVLAHWWFFLRGEVVSYGAVDRTYFSQARAVEGDEIEICYEAITWKRLCRSKLVTYVVPFRGPRLDLATYDVKTPPKRGPVDAKCRAWPTLEYPKVPSLGGNDPLGRPYRAEGPAVWTGHIESECSIYDHWFAAPIYTALPPVRFEWLRRPRN